MGTKYSSVSVTSYNSAPPPDNGSTGSDNQITWAKITAKIGGPLKTAIEAVNTALLTTFDQSSRLVFISDNTIAADHNKVVQISSAVTSTITVSLGDAATMAAGYRVTIANQSAVACVVGRATGGDTINGTAGNIAIGPLESISFQVNVAANGYIVLSRFSSAATQAEQEAGTSAVAPVTPSTQQFHPSAAKGWVRFDPAGNPTAAYNVTSVTDNGTGSWAVVWATDFSSANYCPIPSVSGGGAAFSVTADSLAAGTTAIFVFDGTNVLADPLLVNVVAFGDQ